MQERQGDLWDIAQELYADYILITTNGYTTPRTRENVMGSGVALSCKQRYPDVPARLGSMLLSHKEKVFATERPGIESWNVPKQIVHDLNEGWIIFSFPTKPGYVLHEEDLLPYYAAKGQKIPAPGYMGQSSMPLIVRSAKIIREYINQVHPNGGACRIILPRPGCGQGGLLWEKVRIPLDKLFDDRYTVVHKN